MSSDATIISPGALVGAGPASALRVRRRSRAGVAIAAASLLVIVGISLLVVVLAANRPSFLVPATHDGFFPRWLAGPLGGLWPSFTTGSNALKYIFTFGIVVMYAAYVLALSHVRQLRARWVIAAVVAAHIVMVLSPPLSLTDIFNYVNYGRMEIVHHLNPYATVPYYEPHGDPSFDLSNWHHLLSPYGPLFTVFTFALVPLGVAASFWVLKVVLMLASLGTIALVWSCARLLGRDPRTAIVFVGLNPLVLIWGLGGDHNDFLMMLLIVGAFYLLLKARALNAPAAARVAPAAAGPSGPSGLLTGVGLRGRGTRLLRGRRPGVGALATIGNAAPSAGAGGNGARAWPFAGRRARPRGNGLLGLVWPLAPLDVAAGTLLVTAVAIKASAAILLPVVLMALLKRPRDLVQVLIGVVGAGIVLAVVTYVAFGLHIPDLSTQARLVTPVSVPNLLGLAVGQGGETQAVRAVMTALLVVGVLASAWWASRHRELGADALVTGAGWASVVLVLTLSWVLPWYVLWMLPLAILSHSRALRTTVLVLGAYLIFAWMPLQADLFRAIHFKPLGTSLGQLDQRETKQLLH
jgi:hypothetical protein